MFNKLYAWIGRHALSLFVFALFVTCIATIISLVDVVRKPPVLEKFEGGIQNHLVWSNKGECFFVRPYSPETVYLIRVKDCDKVDTTIQKVIK
jgi:hypothetical protein